MSRSLHFAPLRMISLAGAALAATPVARQDPSQPSLTPVLFFNSLEQVTACQSTNVLWVYDGPNIPMDITVTNVDVNQADPPPPPSESISRTLTDNSLPRRAVPTGAFQIAKPIATVLPKDALFNWTQVNVPQGWYKLFASIPAFEFSQSSTDFYVEELGDTSCLLSTISSSSSPQPTPPSTGSPTSPSPSPSPSQSASQTVIPVSGASSSVNKGAIAGGVIGGVVLLLVVIGIYLCLLRSKRRSNQPHSPRSHGPPALVSSKRGSHRVGGWGGLSSVDSQMFDPTGRKSKPQPKPYTNTRHHSQTESLGPIIPGGVAASEEDIRSYRTGGPFSPSEEKVGLDEIGAGVLPYSQSTRPGVMGRSYSASTVGSTNDYAMGRRPSVSSANALPPGARRPSIEYPPYAMSPSPQMDRTASNASSPPQSQAQPRKTPRKPVPAYSPASASPSSSSSSPITSSPTTPASVSPFDDERAQRRVSGGHYTTRARDGSRDRGGRDGKDRRDKGGKSSPEGGPVLIHKSSFGPGGVEGKPLHYLIPDMPPPSVG